MLCLMVKNIDHQETIEDLQFYWIALTVKCLLIILQSSDSFDSSTTKLGDTATIVLLLPGGSNRLVPLYELSQIPLEVLLHMTF